MSHDTLASVSLLLLALGLGLYVLLNTFTPTQVQAGPVHLGEAQGDCHGISRKGEPIFSICK